MRYYLMTLGVIFVAKGALALATVPQETIACGLGIEADRCVAGTLVMQNDDFSSMRVLVVDTTYGPTDVQLDEEVAFVQSGAAFYSMSAEVRGLICSNEIEAQAFATLDDEGFYQSGTFGSISQDDMVAALLEAEVCSQTFPGPAIPRSSGCGDACSIFSSEMLSFHFLFGALFMMGRKTKRKT